MSGGGRIATLCDQANRLWQPLMTASRQIPLTAYVQSPPPASTAAPDRRVEWSEERRVAEWLAGSGCLPLAFIAQAFLRLPKSYPGRSSVGRSSIGALGNVSRVGARPLILRQPMASAGGGDMPQTSHRSRPPHGGSPWTAGRWSGFDPAAFSVEERR